MGPAISLALIGMTLSKERKVYVGLLAVALLAVAADQAILGTDVAGPEKAAAKPTPAVSGLPAPAGSHGVATNGGQTPTAGWISDKIQQATDGLQQVQGDAVSDAFAVSHTWLGDSTGKPEPESSQLTPPDAFERRYPLMAVITMEDDSYAVLGGFTLRIGQSLDGYQLVAIKERSVVLVSKAGRHEWMLPAKADR